MTDSGNNTVETREDLVAYLESGCKPEAKWMLGTEHEKFGYTLNDLRPLPYSGKSGINAILTGLADEFDWRPVMENGLPIALLDDTGASITLEPGGQLELSGALLDNIHQTCTEVNTHLKQVRAVSEPLGAAFLGMGFQPKWRLEDMEWMPKARYRIMREYMNKVGTLGQDMMARTCTVQVNLDYGSEADMVQEIPYITGAAACRYSPVRQFTIYRWKAQRLSQLPFPCLGRYGSGSHRHVAFRFRWRHGF